MSGDSTYIDSIPETKYQELSDSFIDRLLNNKGAIASVFANLIDEYATNKGKIFTAALSASGFAKNPEQLENYYSANQAVIDGYFEQVDLQALAGAFGGDMEKAVVDSGLNWIKTRLPAFAVGSLTGVALFVYAKKKRNKK